MCSPIRGNPSVEEPSTNPCINSPSLTSRIQRPTCNSHTYLSTRGPTRCILSPDVAVSVGNTSLGQDKKKRCCNAGGEGKVRGNERSLYTNNMIIVTETGPSYRQGKKRGGQKKGEGGASGCPTSRTPE